MAMKKDIISTGLVEFELNFDRGNGNVCTEKVYFNPNDPEFFSRIADMIEYISGLYEGYEEKYANANDGKEKLKLVCELGDEIRQSFDVAFGNDVSSVIFKYVSPHGFIREMETYYSFYILDILRGKIEKELGETSKLVNEALKKANNKHTKKYAHKFN